MRRPLLPPRLPDNHQRCAYRLWPELLNQENTFADDTFITINQANLIKKVIAPLQSDSHKWLGCVLAYLCPTESSRR